MPGATGPSIVGAGEPRRQQRQADRVSQLTLLGSVRDACGDVLPSANAVQFNGTGTYNGAAATFRVCVQDNGEGANAASDLVHVACTAGCSYSGGGALGGGNLQVKQR